MRMPKSDTFSIFAVSSLRRGHANLLCIVPIFTDDAEAFQQLAGAISKCGFEAHRLHSGLESNSNGTLAEWLRR